MKNKKKIIIIPIILLSTLILIKPTKKPEEHALASTTNTVKLYDQNLNEIMEVPRGTKIETLKTNQEYTKIIYQNQEYLVKTENVNDKIVLEQTIYVRTPCIVYKDNFEIQSSLKKGEKLNIIGYDYIDTNGNVNMYKIETETTSGYVYQKYLNQNEQEALKNYDNGYYEIHQKRTNTLGGGDAATLDYYPYEHPTFENNTMPQEVRSIYLNAESIKQIDTYIEYAKGTNINAFVVDIKENTIPSYKSEILKKLSKTNYDKALYEIEEYQNAIKKLNDNNYYVIGRITTFKDDYYAIDNETDAIYDIRTNKPYHHNNAYWPSAYSRNVWYYNVELAKEAVKLMGFNEIQFDYVRFPDKTTSIEPYLDYKNQYNETKAQAIQGFVMYACDELHKLNVYVSIDVFAESAHQYVTSYGQYFPAISNIADVISPMPYPDHFNKNQYGIKEPVWTVPYLLLTNWSKYAIERQKETTTQALIRPWIQAYDTINAPYIKYDNQKIEEQLQALYDSGIKNGFITWNSSSSLIKYKEIKESLQKNYKE